MTETILITGILGQDGAYLAKLAVEKGCRVIGGARQHSSTGDWRLRELGVRDHVEIVELDLLDVSGLRSTISTIRPTRIFNLAAQSFVSSSFNEPILTSEVNALGAMKLLEIIRQTDPSIRYYQASTCEMFGLVREFPQTEVTPFNPRSPYGISKAFAHFATRHYRDAYGLHASSGILFNHESPLRGDGFVTKKIVSTLVRIFRGSHEVLYLGNLNARRDWGHARDYVRGMWSMTEQERGDDYVLATGIATSVREFILLAARHLGLRLEMTGSDHNEVARFENGTVLCRVDPSLFRPADVDLLVGDPTKARKILGWSAETSIDELVQEMIDAEMQRSKQR